ncbi:MAG: AAA family ATPase [bacterium]|nr:AAA family ATPase [bacterium]
MTKIFTVGNTKGGVGKSTNALQLAIGLALSGSKVWLVDGDRQGTSLAALTVRAEAGLPPISASAYTDGATLRTQVKQQAHNYDYVVIDAGGRDSSALRAALTVSDVVLIPFLPRSFDIWALEDMAVLLEETRAVHDIRAIAFLNMADPTGTDNEEAKEAVAQLPGMELLSVQLKRLKPLAYASGSGQHISEYKPRHAKACEEAAAFQQAVLDSVNTSV